MTSIERALEIIKSCRNEQQTEVATRFVDLLINTSKPALSREEKTTLLRAIDNRLNEMKHELMTQRRIAFV